MKNKTLSSNTTDYSLIVPYFNSLSIILIVLYLLGIVLNLITITVILKTKKLKPISLLILNLALADLVYISGIPLFVVHAFSQSWPFKLIGCQLFFLTDFIGMIVGVYTVATLSVERFLEISNKKIKFSYQLKLNILILLLVSIWVLAILFSLPMVSSIELKSVFNDTISTCDTTWSSFNLNIYLVIKFVLSFIMPVSLILYSSIKLLVYLKKCKHISKRLRVQYSSQRKLIRISSKINSDFDFKSDMTETSLNQSLEMCKLKYANLSRQYKSLQIKHKAIKVVLSIDLFFFIQWLPLWLAELLKAIYSVEWLEVHIHLFNLIATIFSYTNSIVNPILYMILTHSFRSFIRDFKCLKKDLI